MDPRVQKVIARMRDYLHRRLSSVELAQSVNLSPSRLHWLFKDEIGMSPARYLQSLRMRRAKELLETTFLSVKEVMAKVGVSDESHFVRDFKKFYGCTPAQYRAEFHSARQDGESAQRQQLPSSVRSLVLSRPGAQKSSATSSVPPLLMRRPSHPRHLAEDQLPQRQSSKLREALALLRFRHQAFAELTTEISAKIALAMIAARSIIQRARPYTGLARRLPPSAKRPRLSPPPPPRSAPS